MSVVLQAVSVEGNGVISTNAFSYLLIFNLFDSEGELVD